ncbi:MAG: enterobactin transporter EntS [Pseudonocardiaceae bacterium]
MAVRSLLLDISPLRENRAFRNLFIARTILLFGVGSVLVTVPLDVYAMTGSTGPVSLVAAVEGLAFFVGFLSGGVLADRSDRKTLIIRSWLVCGASFAGLALNAAFVGALWPVFLFVATNGVSGAMGITALLAVLPSLVGRSKLHAVGALNTLSLRLGTVLAPTLGGVIVSVADAQWSYALGGLAALGSSPLLRGLPSDPGGGGDAGEGPLRSLVSAYRFVARQQVVLGVMVAGVVGMIGGGSLVLAPAFVDARFGGEPAVVGLMYSAISVGLVVGALVSGWLTTTTRPGLVLLLMMIVCFACYAAAGAAPAVLLVLVFLVGAGMANSMEEVLRYALLQLHTPDAMLGRVNSAFAAQNMSGAAVGALVAGAFATWFGPGEVFWIYNAVMAAVSVMVLVLLRTLRRTGAAPPQ